MMQDPCNSKYTSYFLCIFVAENHSSSDKPYDIICAICNLLPNNPYLSSNWQGKYRLISNIFWINRVPGIIRRILVQSLIISNVCS